MRAFLVGFVAFAAILTVALPADRAAAAEDFDVLIFHDTKGFRHGSISDGIEAIEQIGDEEGFSVTDTRNASIMSASGLAPFEVVIFLSTTGDILTASQEQAFENYMASGGGYVGIHAAADTEYSWGFYEDLMGAYFNGHPSPQTATVDVTAPGHPIMDGIPSTFSRYDEWYNYRNVPALGVTVLATLDESTYNGGNMGDPHPIMWAHEFGGGRSFYTGFGHTSGSFGETVVLDILANAIVWASGDDTPPPPPPSSGTFTDDDGSVFEDDIEWLAAQGITLGCNPPANTRFCPNGHVTRGQLAAFLVRALNLAAAPGDRFVDDDGSVFEKDIQSLAAAGITVGCNPPINDRFCPDNKLSRGQMAALLVRAFNYTDDGGGDLFDDDNASIFERDIDRLATAGVTLGCNPPTNNHFCPTSTVTRAQMAAFFHRAMG
jgi:type 1 glutamine amidotransferase